MASTESAFSRAVVVNVKSVEVPWNSSRLVQKGRCRDRQEHRRCLQYNEAFTKAGYTTQSFELVDYIDMTNDNDNTFMITELVGVPLVP
jgi:hypothetical protein